MSKALTKFSILLEQHLPNDDSTEDGLLQELENIREGLKKLNDVSVEKRLWREDALTTLEEIPEDKIRDIVKSVMLIWDQLTGDQQQHLKYLPNMNPIRMRKPPMKRGYLKDLQAFVEVHDLHDAVEQALSRMGGGGAQRAMKAFLQKAINWKCTPEEIKRDINTVLLSKGDDTKITVTDIKRMETTLQRGAEAKGGLSLRSTQDDRPVSSASSSRVLRARKTPDASQAAQKKQVYGRRKHRYPSGDSITLKNGDSVASEAGDESEEEDQKGTDSEDKLFTAKTDPATEDDDDDAEGDSEDETSNDATFEIGDEGIATQDVIEVKRNISTMNFRHLPQETPSQPERKRKASSVPPESSSSNHSPRKKRQRIDDLLSTPVPTIANKSSTHESKSTVDSTQDTPKNHAVKDDSLHFANVTSAAGESPADATLSIKEKVQVKQQSKAKTVGPKAVKTQAEAVCSTEAKDTIQQTTSAQENNLAERMPEEVGASLIQGAEEWTKQLYLSAGTWLNNESILRSLRLLCHPMHTHILDMAAEDVLVWPDTKLIVVPVNITSHWLLVVVDVSSAMARTYNSKISMTMEDKDRADVERRLRGILEQLGTTLTVQWAEPEKCYQQPNGYDCGIHTIINALHVSYGKDPPMCSSGDVWRVVLSDVLSTTRVNRASYVSYLQKFWSSYHRSQSFESTESAKKFEQRLVKDFEQIANLIEIFGLTYDPSQELQARFEEASKAIEDLQDDMDTWKKLDGQSKTEQGRRIQEETLIKYTTAINAKRQTLEPIQKCHEAFRRELRFVDLQFNLDQIQQCLHGVKAAIKTRQAEVREQLVGQTLQALRGGVEDLKVWLASGSVTCNKHLEMVSIALELIEGEQQT